MSGHLLHTSTVTVQWNSGNGKSNDFNKLLILLWRKSIWRSTVDVPLGEDIEGYEIEILNGASVKRTLSVDQTTVTYSEADQIADWGTPQASYQVRVFQMSATRGRGFPRSATV